MPKLASDKNKSAYAEAPTNLKPYIFHGLDIDWSTSSSEATTDCVFCGKEGKFSINIDTGLWRCLRCGGGEESGGGSIATFMKNFWDLCDQHTTNYSRIQKMRGIKYEETLMSWGIVKSVLTEKWMLPGWVIGKDGKVRLQQLYVYTKTKDRWMMMPTPERGHALFGLNLLKDQPEIYITEGPWDAIRLWEAFKHVRYESREGQPDRVINVNPGAPALLSELDVIALPSATVSKALGSLLRGVTKSKISYLWFDNDHPRINKQTKQEVEPAGHAGMRRVSAIIAGSSDNVNYIKWGPDGYDATLKDGLDVSDCLTDMYDKGFAKAIEFLFTRTQKVPGDWIDSASIRGIDSLQSKPCNKWKTLVNSWRKAMKWSKGLDHALSTMLASIASVNTQGDQLWVKIIGPASCGKSTLCEAVSVNKKYVLAKSTIRGFHSGYRVQGNEGKDNALIAQVNGLALVTKDGDTLLQSPNLPQILSEARDVYDCVSRTHYRNALSKDYEGIRMAWILCGTNSLRGIDTSELGQRFLDCVIMEDIDEEQEDEVLWRVANKSAEQSCREILEGESTSQQSEEMTECMQLTSGYIDWLKKETGRKLSEIEFSDEAKRVCIRIGKFVAFMRARPSKINTEKASREFAARLVSQHTRYARCLALVLNKPSIDREILDRVTQIGLDTARGILLDITRLLFVSGEEGKQVRAIHLLSNGSATEPELRSYIRFMQQIGIVELASTKKPDRWRLTPRMEDLCERLGFGDPLLRD